MSLMTFTGMYGEEMKKEMVSLEGTDIEGTTTTTSIMFCMSCYGSL